MSDQNLKLPKDKAQIFPQPYPSAPCDMYGCSNRAKWFIGRPDGPLSLPLRVCDECMRNIVASIPDEYLGAISAQSEAEKEAGKDTSGETEASVESYLCPHCGKEFDKQQGLSAHLRHCKAANNEVA